MIITRNGQYFELTSDELYEAYREQDRKFLRSDAEAQVREFLGVRGEFDEASRVKCLKKLGAFPNDLFFEVVLDELCDLFEKRRDCEIGDNYVWKNVIEEYAECYAQRNKV